MDVWSYNKTGEPSLNLVEFWQVKQIYPEKTCADDLCQCFKI